MNNNQMHEDEAFDKKKNSGSKNFRNFWLKWTLARLILSQIFKVVNKSYEM